MAIALTDSFIVQALGSWREGSEPGYVDAVASNLRIDVTSSAAKWFVTVEAATRSPRELSLGEWPDVGVAEARTYANALSNASRSSNDVEAAGCSLQHLLELYDKRKLSQHRQRRATYRCLKAAVATIQDRDAGTVGRKEVAAIVDGIADRAPIHANKTLANLRAFFSWAVGRGYMATNPALGISAPARARARDRTPSLEELIEIWRAAAAIGYPCGLAVQLLILTAARRGEVGAMAAAELQLPESQDEGVWILPAERSKNGRAIRTPLAPLARKVVEQALATRKLSGPYIFSCRRDNFVKNWSRTKARFDKIILQNRRQTDSAAEPMPPWRFHDLRRSFATHACDHLQIDPAVADRCLNHTGSSTTSTISRVYGRNEMFEQRRMALQKWADLIAKQLELPRAP